MQAYVFEKIQLNDWKQKSPSVKKGWQDKYLMCLV